jgi:hypothetical protein
MLSEKIKAAIKAKFPDAKIAPDSLTKIVALIEAKVGTDETQIDATIDTFNEFNPIAEIIKTDGTIAGLKGRLKAAIPPKKKAETEVDPGDDPGDNNPEGKKPDETTLLLRQLVEKVTKLEGEKTINTIKANIKKGLEGKVDDDYWSEWMLPEKEEDVPAFVEKVQTKYNGFVQQATDHGLSVIGTPKGGVGGSGDAKATKEEVSAVVDSII